MDFNINHYVKVKLTGAGKAELRRQYEEFRSQNPKVKLPRFELPKEDEEGWSKWQLWNLMNTFGHMLFLGSIEIPFDPTIKIGE